MRIVHARIDLVGRVPAHHMMDGQVTAGVLVEPIVEFESIAFVDDNQVAIRNKSLDFPGGDEAITVHGEAEGRCLCRDV